MKNEIDYKYEIKDEVTKTHFESLILELVKAYELFTAENITYFWLDVGSSVYDLHIEFATKNSNGESYDLYLEVNNNNLIGCYTYAGIDFSKVVGKELVAKLINAIKEVKTQKREVQNVQTTYPF